MRRQKRRVGRGSKSENAEMAAMEPRATRSSGSRIMLGIKSGGGQRRQRITKENTQVKKAGNGKGWM